MKQVLLPVVITACAAAMAYAAGPQAPVQLAQVQYKEAPQGTYKVDKGSAQGTYKMDKGAGQGGYKMDPGAQGQFKAATPPGAQRGAAGEATDQDHKDWSRRGAPGAQGNLKGEAPYGSQGQYKAPGGQALKGEGQPQYQRPDKDYKGQGGLYGQQKTDPAYGQQKMGPGGPGGGFGQDAFHK